MMSESKEIAVADMEKGAAIIEEPTSKPGPDVRDHASDTASDIEKATDPRSQEAQQEKSEEESAPNATKGPGGPFALPKEHPMHPSNFPDGGAEAWLVVVGCFCLFFVTFGWLNCIGVFQDYYQTHQLRNYSPSNIAWIASIESFFMLGGGPIVGRIFDNYGPRWLLAVGTFLHVFGLMMVSISTEYYQFILSQAVCSPIGMSCCFFPAISAVSTWFFKRRGLAFGIVASGSSLGGVLLPIAAFRLFPAWGFGWTMRFIGFLTLLLLIIANFTVRSRLPPRKTPLRITDFLTPFTELIFDLNLLAAFCAYLTLLVPINFIILSAAKAGMSYHLQNYLVSILNAASLFGRILPGWFADKFGRFNSIICTTFLQGIFCLAVWIPAKSNAPIIVFAALYGFSSGAFVSLAPACVAQITKDITKIGVRNGTAFATLAVASLIGNPVAGALVDDYNGKYTGLQIFSGAMPLGAVFIFLLCRQAQIGFGPGKIVQGLKVKI